MKRSIKQINKAIEILQAFKNGKDIGYINDNFGIFNIKEDNDIPEFLEILANNLEDFEVKE